MYTFVRSKLLQTVSPFLLLLSPPGLSLAQSASPSGMTVPASRDVGPAKPGSVNPHGAGGVPTTRGGTAIPAVGPLKPGMSNPHSSGASTGTLPAVGPVKPGVANPHGSGASTGTLPAVGPVKPGVANPHGGTVGSGTVGTGAPSAGASSTGSSSSVTPVSGGLSFPKDAEPLAKGSGVVEGTLTHPAPDTARLKGVEVRLFAFKGGQRVGEWRQFTEAGGTFRFTELNTGTDVKYIVSAMYQAAVYLGGNLQFPEGQTSLAVPIEVKDSTAAPGPLTISTLHIIVEATGQDGALRITEVLSLDNPGDKTLVGGPESTVTLQLDMPAGFVNVQAVQGLLATQLSMGEKLLAFEGPIYPGESQLVFSYELPPTASRVFKRRMPVGASEVDVWVEPGGPAVLGPQLSQKEPITVEETTFNRFSAGAVGKGSAITFSMGVGEVANSSKTQAPTTPIVTAVVLLTLGFVLQPFFRKRSKVALSGPDAQRLQTAELVVARDRALQSIKEAEFDFAAGKLTPEDFQKLRHVYKDEAIQAIQALKTLEGGKEEAGQLEAGSALPAAPSAPVAAAPAQSLQPAASGAAPAAEPHAGAATVPVSPATLALPGDGSSAAPPTAAAAPAHLAQKRFCTACGTPAQPEDRFCLACGKSIRTLEAPAS